MFVCLLALVCVTVLCGAIEKPDPYAAASLYWDDWRSVAYYAQATKYYCRTDVDWEFCAIFAKKNTVLGNLSLTLPDECVDVHTHASASVHTSPSPVRVLCTIATHEGSHLRATAVASTWGARCDGFLAFSNASDASIPTVVSSYEGVETYWNLWQKKVFMYEDVWEHFKDDFDFFFFGDDDTFVRVDQLRIYLEQLRATQAPGVYAGRRIRIGAYPDEHDFDYFYNSGGGYVLDREALGRLTEVLGRDTSEGPVPPCKDGIGRTSNGTADVHTSRCLRAASPPVLALDTRDCQGKERFHHVNPIMVSMYTGHASEAIGNHYAHHSMGFRPFLEGVAPSAVVFHLLKSPEYMSQSYLYLKHCRGTRPKATDAGERLQAVPDL